MEVELVPVIEILSCVLSTTEQPDRQGRSAAEWDAHFALGLKLDGLSDYRRLIPGRGLYRVSQFSTSDDLLRIVHAHLGGDDPDQRIQVADSCALFGGYVLLVEERVVCVPQCCGTLADFASWRNAIDDSFVEGWICPEGHPSPRLTRRQDLVDLSFDDDHWESYVKPAIACTVKHDRLRRAIAACEVELSTFARELNGLGTELGCPNVAQTLIHELS